MEVWYALYKIRRVRFISFPYLPGLFGSVYLPYVGLSDPALYHDGDFPGMAADKSDSPGSKFHYIKGAARAVELTLTAKKLA